MRAAAYLIFAAIVVAADQLSKWFATEMLVRTVLEKPEPQSMGFITWLTDAPERLGYIEQPVWPFFNIVMVWNQGVSFGLLKNHSEYGPLLLVLLSFVITVFFAVWLFRTRSHAQSLGIALVIAGAVGNVIDRLRFGAVIDFLDFHIAGYHWPAFNVADSCIVGGVFLLIIYALFFEKSFQQPAQSH